MKPHARLRSSLAFLLPALLLLGLPTRCFALIELMDVSKARAKELGVTVRVTPRPEDVRVQVEFQTAGDLKGFKHGDLEVSQGGKRLLLAAIQARKPAVDSPADRKQLEFYIDPAALPNATVTIVSYNEPMSGIGYRLKMKDFLAQATSR